MLNEANEINIAYDAGLGSGNTFDGVTFIAPVRIGINPDEEDEDGERIAPLKLVDSLSVNIHPIAPAAYNYLNEGGYQDQQDWRAI